MYSYFGDTTLADALAGSNADLHKLQPSIQKFTFVCDQKFAVEKQAFGPEYRGLWNGVSRVDSWCFSD